MEIIDTELSVTIVGSIAGTFNSKVCMLLLSTALKPACEVN